MSLKPKDFRAVIDKMVEADREAALLAAASALTEYHTAAKEERDAERQKQAEERAAKPAPKFNIKTLN